MITITVEKECGCFRKSGMKNHITFQNKDAALMEAMRLSDTMNETFCQKHEFSVREEGDRLLIGVAERPREGGCCGGGHCG